MGYAWSPALRGDSEAHLQARVGGFWTRRLLLFSGARKPAYLVAARLCIEGKKVSWPKAITGIRAQLVMYDPLKDRSGLPKFPQDIVATMGMSCFVTRILMDAEISEEPAEEDIAPFGGFQGRGRFTQRESIQERSKRAEAGIY